MSNLLSGVGSGPRKKFKIEAGAISKLSPTKVRRGGSASLRRIVHAGKVSKRMQK